MESETKMFLACLATAASFRESLGQKADTISFGLNYQAFADLHLDYYTRILSKESASVMAIVYDCFPRFVHFKLILWKKVLRSLLD